MVLLKYSMNLSCLLPMLQNNRIVVLYWLKEQEKNIMEIYVLQIECIIQ